MNINNPIYNNQLIFGKEYTRKELDQVTEIPASSSDNRTVEYIDVIGLGNDRMTNKKQTYAEFQLEQMKYAQDTLTDYNLKIWDRSTESNIPNPNFNKSHKDYQHGIIPCVLIDESSLSKKESNVKDRSMILLDFDAMGDKTFKDLHDVLSPYQYFGWTTFNDQVAGKGRRYRVMMMMAETYATAAEWNLVKEGIVDWMTANGFTLDKSGSLTYTQLGIGPAFNPAINKITFFRNDVDNRISFAHLKKAPITKPAPAKSLVRKSSAIGTKEYIEDDSTNIAYADKQIANLLKTEEGRNKFAELLVSVCGTHLIVDTISPDNKQPDLKIGDRAGFGLNNVVIKTPNGFIKTKIGSAKLFWAYTAAISNKRLASKYFVDVWDKISRKGYTANQVIAKANEPNTGITTQGITDLIELSGIGATLGLQQSIRASIKDYKSRLQQEMHGLWTHVEPTTDGYIPDDVLKHAEGDFIALQAGTGSGKTYSNKQLGHLVGVPYKSIEAQYSDDGVINNVVVYDNLYHKANGSNYETVVIDEVHDLAYMSYRPKAFGYISEVSAHQWDNPDYTPAMILQSGTVYYSDIKSVYESAKRLGESSINFKAYKLDKPLRQTTYQVVHPIPTETETNEEGEVIEVKSKSYSDQIIELIQAGVESDQLVYVIRNDQKENDKVADILNNLGVGAISVSRDAINKSKQMTGASDVEIAINDFYNNAEFKQKAHKINGNPLSVILATVIGVEGVNIQDEVESARVIVVGEIHEAYVKQSQGRYRKAKSIQLIHFFFRQDSEWCNWLEEKLGPKPVVEDRLKRFDILADSIDRIIESGVDVTAMNAESLARRGYYKRAGKVKESIFKPLIRAGIKNDFEFYQSTRHMEANMEVWGCDIDRSVVLTYNETVSQAAKDKAKADAKAKIDAKKLLVQSLIDSSSSIGELVSLVEKSVDPLIKDDLGLVQLLRHCANEFVCPIDFVEPNERELLPYNFKNKCKLTFDEFVEVKRKEFAEGKTKPKITDVGTNSTGKITKQVTTLIMKYIENKLDFNSTDWDENHNTVYRIPGMIDFVNNWYDSVGGKPSADELKGFIRAFTNKLIKYYTVDGTDPVAITMLICDSWFGDLATVCETSGYISWGKQLLNNPKIWFAKNNMMMFGERTTKRVTTDDGESVPVHCYPIIR